MRNTHTVLSSGFSAGLTRRIGEIATMLCTLAVAHAAQAGGLSISPMRLDLGAGRDITQVTVHNPTPETLAIELEAVPWGSSVATQSARDLTINPPTAVLRPGARLTVRIGLAHRMPADHEVAYRLHITELPQPLAIEAAGIGMRLRVGLPVFVAAAQPKPAALQWSLQRNDRGAVLVARNPGNVHERLQSLSLIGPNESTPLALAGAGYVLAGGQAEYVVPSAWLTMQDPVAPLRVVGHGKQGTINVTLRGQPGADDAPATTPE
jgi:fimbrial chaperone protein